MGIFTKCFILFCPTVAATFVVGLFWRRANGSGSIAALLTGFIAAVIMVAASVLVSQAESAGTEAPG